MSSISKSTLANFTIAYLQSLTKENKLVDIMIISNLIIRHTDKVDLVYSYMVSIALACMHFFNLGSLSKEIENLNCLSILFKNF